MARFDFGTTPANTANNANNLNSFGTVGVTVPPTDTGYQPTDPAGYTPTTPEDISSGGKTEIVGETESGIRPVTGWLVCIKGVNKGKDFRLHSQRNYIGRSSAVDVCIDDPKVSREPSVEIAYDPYSRAFFVASCRGAKQITYLNNRPLMGDRDLVNGDVLRLGDTELIFVPLCGDNFAWPEDEADANN
jgi:pSer/pThr/pTyr-binding forkhead associated (FHA) protein